MRDKSFSLKLVTAGIFVFVLLYFYFFILTKQHWTLVDDYENVLIASSKDFHFRTFLGYFEKYKESVGRFQPFSNLMLVFRLAFFPQNPVFFHFYQFILAGLVFFFFYRVAILLGLPRFQAILAVFFASFGFPIKDMILYSTASETMMLLFFFLSLIGLLSKRYVLSFFALLLLFTTKESCIGLIPAYPAIIYLREKSFNKRTYFYLNGLLALTFGLLSITWHLPHLYTSRFAGEPFHLKNFIISFLSPPLKNYSPVIFALLILYGSYWLKDKNFSFEIQKSTVFFALSILLPFYTVIVLWMPFDHWWYLHLPIPFAWSLLFAALWPDPRSPLDSHLESAFIFFIILFGAKLISTGAYQYQIFLTEAEKVGTLVCHESQFNPKLHLYSNCNEGSKQMMNYAYLETRCVPGQIPKPVTSKFEIPYILFESQRCGPLNTSENSNTQRLRFWGITRSF